MVGGIKYLGIKKKEERDICMRRMGELRGMKEWINTFARHFYIEESRLGKFYC